MKLHQLLGYLPEELLIDLMGACGMAIEGRKDLQIQGLIGHVKRGGLEREKEILDYIEKHSMSHELRGVISKAQLTQPDRDEDLFATIHRNLEPVERIVAKKSELIEEKKARESIPEPEARDDTIHEEDTTEWRENPARKMDIYKSMEYTLGEAMADVIDNCISAKSDTVWVQFTLNQYEGKRNVIIVDNGTGMDEDELDHAMDIGAERDYAEKDLGKFGIGLKTSSLSQADEITVLSQKGEGGDWCLRRISYEYVTESNNFRLLKKKRKTNAFETALEMLPVDGGTAVIWEEMDEESINLRNTKARNDFEKEVTRVRDFLSLVFHRYLTGKNADRRKIQIIVNGTDLIPLDPLMEDNKGGGVNDTLIHTETESFEYKGNEYDIRIKWVLLPHTTRIEKPLLDRLKKVGDGLNKDQGVYLYRNDRLVKFGGWQGIQSSRGTPLIIDDHTKLAKVAIEVPHQLDRPFRLSSTKRHYKIPPGKFRDGLSYNIREPRHMWKNVSGKNISFIKMAKERYGQDGIKKSNVKVRKPKFEITVDEKGEFTGIKSASDVKVPISRAVKDRKVEIVIDMGSVGGQKLIDSVPAGNTEKIVINRNHPLFPKAVKKLKEELKDL